MTANLDQDPRWIRLHDQTWTCSCCGLKPGGVFDLACDKPEFWEGAEEQKPNADVLTSPDILTEDFCVLKSQYFFVRTVLLIPIIGAPDSNFGYGVWASLSKDNFDRYRETFDSGKQGNLGPWFSWFSNRLKGYPDTLNLKCQVHPRDGRRRPYLELEPTEHPLAVEQKEGITFDRLLEIYALNGHDLRDALAA